MLCYITQPCRFECDLRKDGSGLNSGYDCGLLGNFVPSSLTRNAMHFYKHSNTFHIIKLLAVFWGFFSSHYDWNSIILHVVSGHTWNQFNWHGFMKYLEESQLFIFSGGSLDDLCQFWWISSLGWDWKTLFYWEIQKWCKNIEKWFWHQQQTSLWFSTGLLYLTEKKKT